MGRMCAIREQTVRVTGRSEFVQSTQNKRPKMFPAKGRKYHKEENIYVTWSLTITLFLHKAYL